MNIMVNGKPEETSIGTIGEYVALGGASHTGVVVVHNGQVLEKSQWEHAHLKQGDTLEILSFVGGG